MISYKAKKINLEKNRFKKYLLDVSDGKPYNKQISWLIYINKEPFTVTIRRGFVNK